MRQFDLRIPDAKRKQEGDRTEALVYRLNGMHHVVAQVGVVNGDHVFALQLLHSAHDVLVYRKHETG